MAGRLILSGFGPFPGVPANPSEAVARALHGQRVADRAIEALVLPVAHPQAGAMLDAHKLDPAQDLVLLLGVAESADRLRVERQAVNLLDFRIPDTAGRQPRGLAIDDQLPMGATLRTRFDTHSIVQALHDADLLARESDDAGRYVCNATYLHALAQANRALFLHVPMPGTLDPQGQVWTHERLVHAARLVLAELVRQSADFSAAPEPDPRHPPC